MLIGFLAGVLPVVLVLGVLVLVHEGGHFAAARSIGVAVQEFALGIGPALYKKQGKDTLYSVRCLPLGGYCLFDTELTGLDARGRSLSIGERPALSRIYISLAGPLMNFVLAAFLFTLLFSLIGLTAYEPVIGKFSDVSPARTAGIQIGDEVLAIAGEAPATFQDISRILAAKGDAGALDFTVRRGNETLTVQVQPVYNAEQGRYLIGVEPDYERTVRQRVNPIRAVLLGWQETLGMIAALVGAIVQMVTGRISVAENLSGPVQLAQVISQTAASGLTNTVFLTAILSVNLGIMNLLPIPVLDGGKILVYLIELIRRRPLRQEIEGWINMVGAAMIVSLVVFLVFKDVFQLFGGGG